MFKNIFSIQLIFALFCVYSCSDGEKKEKLNYNSSLQASEKLNVLLIIADDLNCDLGAEFFLWNTLVRYHNSP